MEKYRNENYDKGKKIHIRQRKRKKKKLIKCCCKREFTLPTTTTTTTNNNVLEVLVGVETRFPLLPVVFGPPVLDYCVQGVGVEPVGEVSAFQGRREAQGQGQTCLQVVDILQGKELVSEVVVVVV